MPYGESSSQMQQAHSDHMDFRVINRSDSCAQHSFKPHLQLQLTSHLLSSLPRLSRVPLNLLFPSKESEMRFHNQGKRESVLCKERLSSASYRVHFLLAGQ